MRVIPPSGAALGSSPKCRTAAVQSEELVKPPVADICPTGAVFLREFGEGIEQAPPRRFRELLMAGVLELPEDRHDVAAVDGSDFGSFHDGDPRFVGADLVKFQIFGYGAPL